MAKEDFRKDWNSFLDSIYDDIGRNNGMNEELLRRYVREFAQKLEYFNRVPWIIWSKVSDINKSEEDEEVE